MAAYLNKNTVENISIEMISIMLIPEMKYTLIPELAAYSGNRMNAVGQIVSAIRTIIAVIEDIIYITPPADVGIDAGSTALKFGYIAPIEIPIPDITIAIINDIKSDIIKYSRVELIIILLATVIATLIKVRGIEYMKNLE